MKAMEMKPKTKSFLLGAVAGGTLLTVALIGLLTYLYFRGTAVSADRLAHKQKQQVQRFGTTCSNAVPEAMAYLLKTLTPTLEAHGEDRFDSEELSGLISGVERQAKFLSHCATQVDFRSESSLQASNNLMAASNGFSNIYALLSGLLTGLRIDNCDDACHQVVVRRAAEESLTLEQVLRGG